MKHCKDCIHYDLCKYNFYKDGCAAAKDADVFISIDDDTICRYFKDKSTYIQIPCNVGDVVYIIQDGKVLERRILDFTYDGQLYVRLRPFRSYEYVIGKNAFLTKTEADLELSRINETINISKELKDKSFREFVYRMKSEGESK